MNKQANIIYQAERALYNEESRSINNVTFEGTKETDLLISVNGYFVTQGVLYLDDDYSLNNPKGKLYNANQTVEFKTVDDIKNYALDMAFDELKTSDENINKLKAFIDDLKVDQ